MFFFGTVDPSVYYANESGRAAARVYLYNTYGVCVNANRKPVAARVFAY